MGYVWTGAAFAYRFNALFPLYVALFSLTGFALVTALASVDPHAIQQSFPRDRGRGVVIAFMLLVALMLGVSELAQLVPAVLSGTTPALITRSNGSGNFVYVLDLGIVMPLALLAAHWLRRRAPWGHVLAGVVLVKAITMGFALLSATWFDARAGNPVDVVFTAIYAFIALGATAVTIVFLRSRCTRCAPASPSRT
jgi:hypothetical protein